MAPKGRQTKKHCFLAMLSKGGRTRKHCFLTMFSKIGQTRKQQTATKNTALGKQNVSEVLGSWGTLFFLDLGNKSCFRNRFRGMEN
jgi:hypothetical protein